MSEHKYNEAYNKGFYDGRKSACWECYDELPLSERVDLMVERGVFIPDILDKIRAEIDSTVYVDSLIFGELIDFRNDKISADEVIEEFNRVTKEEVFKIIDKYKER